MISVLSKSAMTCSSTRPPPLEAGVEMTGPITATLYVSSDARDTDFTAKLVDVHPDGTAFFLQEGVLRARYREGFDRKVFMEDGEVYEITVVLDATSNLLPGGPPDPPRGGLGELPALRPQPEHRPATHYDETEWIVARNAVHHSPEYPSHVLLPIMPEGASRLLELN